MVILSLIQWSCFEHQGENMFESTLDQIHQVAIQVQDIQRSIEWYQSHFTLEVTWQDQT